MIKELSEVGGGKYALGIGVRFLKTVESRHAELRDAFALLEGHVEAAGYERGEVEMRHFVEQLVVVYRVAGVSEHKEERSLAFCGELPLLGGIGLRGVGNSGASAPKRTNVERTRTHFAATLKALEYHAGHGGDIGFGIVFHQTAQFVGKFFGRGRVETAEHVDEDKLRTVDAFGELIGRLIEIRFHHVHLSLAISVVGGRVERVLNLFSVAGKQFVVGSRNGFGMFVIGPGGHHVALHFGGHVGTSPSGVEQEELVVGFGEFLVACVVLGQARKRFLCQGEVFEVVLFDDAGIVESVHNDVVRGGARFVGEGYLLHVVGAFVGIFRGVDLLVVFPVLLFGCGYAVVGSLDGIFRLVVVTLAASICQHGTVGAAPIVFVLAFAPLLGKVLLALHHLHGVVEVPGLLLVALRGGVLIGCLVPVACVGTVGLCACIGCRVGFGAALFGLFFLQCINDAVNGGIAVGFAHSREFLQTVLQGYGGGEGHEFVEHGGATLYFFVVFVVLSDESECFGVALLGFVELALCPVDFA